jgi:hypothetical protein
MEMSRPVATVKSVSLRQIPIVRWDLEMADRFVRGLRAHKAKFARWRCERCGQQYDMDIHTHHMWEMVA